MPLVEVLTFFFTPVLDGSLYALFARIPWLLLGLNPNKAGLSKGSFFLGEGQFDPPFIFQEKLA